MRKTAPKRLPLRPSAKPIKQECVKLEARLDKLAKLPGRLRTKDWFINVKTGLGLVITGIEHREYWGVDNVLPALRYQIQDAEADAKARAQKK